MEANDTKLIKQLLETGVHFGHQTNRWNPKMEKFIFGKKSGIYIIDLEKTAQYLKQAMDFLRDVTRAGSFVLFVGTKRQAQAIVKEEAIRCGMFYVNQRWLGGTLTNFQTIRKSVKKLIKMENWKTDGTFENLSKKERSTVDKEILKLLKNLEGIRNMDRLPGAIFVVDSKKEDIAVSEAKRLSIPIVALIDTNSNPDKINYVIPGNDDAIKSIKLVTSLIADSAEEGRKQFVAASSDREEEKKAEALAKEVDDKEVEELIEGDIRLKEGEKVKEEPLMKNRKPGQDKKKK
ncbi:MAG: 30S ribosomal protein S2 [Candidatus Omnitrophica bacterium]|nr:30S ribosomal protein S2 [Candidatus Omnitrophota bacterium]